MEGINALKPNLWAALPDEVPAWATAKRNRVSVDRTLLWLDECLSLHAVCRSFFPTLFPLFSFTELICLKAIPIPRCLCVPFMFWNDMICDVYCILFCERMPQIVAGDEWLISSKFEGT